MSSQVTNHWSVDHVSMVTEILRHPDATGLLGTVRNAMREVANSEVSHSHSMTAQGFRKSGNKKKRERMELGEASLDLEGLLAETENTTN